MEMRLYFLPIKLSNPARTDLLALDGSRVPREQAESHREAPGPGSMDATHMALGCLGKAKDPPNLDDFQ